jgi:hypothetical protein
MKLSNLLKNSLLLFTLFLLLNITAFSQTIMFDDFTYSGINDAQLPVFNKWQIINGVSGPPEGAQYSRNNVAFITDPNNAANKLMTLTATVNGTTKATTHARIETSGFEYFEGTYAARVYLSDTPFTYKDANIQTFYTIVSSALAQDGTKYSELDIVEYMAADKWGISPDNPVLYTTSYHKYIANPWQAWKTYFYSKRSWAGWHTFIASCTDGDNVRYWIDDLYLGAHSVTDSESQAGLPVYPRSNMQVAFANWIWNNVTGSSTADRTTTMQVDWTLHYKNQALTLQQINDLVTGYRTQGLQRRNLAGQTVITTPCTVPSQPAAIAGNTSVASGSSQTYSITAVSGATSYTWTLPSGWSGTSSTTSITTTAGSTGGTIAVRANNACGSGTARTLNVTISTTSANLALNKPATVSTIEGAGFEGSKAVDGNSTTRWATVEGVDPQWISVDLGATYAINRVRITWEAAYATAYQIQLSSDGSSWTTIRQVTGNTSLTNDQTGLSGTGRYIRINGTARGTAWGYSIYELEVYGTPSTDIYSNRIEAESYTNMQGVITEATSDVDGVSNVGAIDVTDWMAYSNIAIPATGTYTVEYRVSSLNGGGLLNLNLNAGTIDLGTLEVPKTNGWQNWTTISHTVTLNAGTYAFGIYASTGGWNINWFRISRQNSARKATAETSEERMNEETVGIYPNPVEATLSIKAWSAFKGSRAKILTTSGKEVLAVKIENGTLDVSSLPPGVYILRLSNGRRSVSEKFIKK